MSNERITRTEVDRLVDTLDRSEPTQTGWRQGFDRLKAALTSARRFRSFFRRPLMLLITVAVALNAAHRLAPQLLNLPDTAPLALAIVAGALLLITEVVMRVRFPVLQLESRVQTLLRYYGAEDVKIEDEAV